MSCGLVVGEGLRKSGNVDESGVSVQHVFVRRGQRREGMWRAWGFRIIWQTSARAELFGMGASVLFGMEGSLVALDQVSDTRSVSSKVDKLDEGDDGLSGIFAVAVCTCKGLLLGVYSFVSRAVLAALEDSCAVSAGVGPLHLRWVEGAKDCCEAAADEASGEQERERRCEEMRRGRCRHSGLVLV